MQLSLYPFEEKYRGKAILQIEDFPPLLKSSDVELKNCTDDTPVQLLSREARRNKRNLYLEDSRSRSNSSWISERRCSCRNKKHNIEGNKRKKSRNVHQTETVKCIILVIPGIQPCSLSSSPSPLFFFSSTVYSCGFLPYPHVYPCVDNSYRIAIREIILRGRKGGRKYDGEKKMWKVMANNNAEMWDTNVNNFHAIKLIP